MTSTPTVLSPEIKTNKSQFKTKIDWKKTSLWLPFLLLAIFMVIIPLIWVVVITLIPVDGYTIKDNWEVIDTTIWQKIGKSLLIAVISTAICLVISFPFCYFLSQTQNKRLKKIIFTMVTS